MSRDLRPVYTAPSEAAAKERFVEFSTKWGRQYPAITRLWENAWSEFVPFLDYDVEIRRVICSTNAIGEFGGFGLGEGPGVDDTVVRGPGHTFPITSLGSTPSGKR